VVHSDAEIADATLSAAVRSSARPEIADGEEYVMVGDSTSGQAMTRFEDLVRAELETINRRRVELQRPEVSTAFRADVAEVTDVVGLALSGGGIRSAAFSLGVLQALNHHDALSRIDYLSTVSGGGYIGSSLTATMTCAQGKFVFGNAPLQTAQRAAEISDTPEIGHLRNYSNYLVPAGARDFLTGIAIIARGLMANVALVFPIVLFLAAATIATNPYRTSLGCPDVLGWEVCLYFPIANFGITLFLSLVGVSLFFLWAIYRSLLPPDRLSEFRTMLPALASGFLLLLAAVFFIELQSFFLRGMFDIGSAAAAAGQSQFDWLTKRLQGLAALTASVAALVTFFRQQLGDVLKAAHTTTRVSTKVVAGLSKVAFWVASAALPLLIWLAYLYLSYWGIINDGTPSAEVQAPPTVIGQTYETASEQVPPDVCQLQQVEVDEQSKPAQPAKDSVADQGSHTPQWMIESATWFTYSIFCPPVRRWADTWLVARILARPMVLLYVALGLALFLASWLLKPNANSLHRLYRDRLSKAFLFDPRPPEGAVKRNEASLDQGRDFPQLDDMPVSALANPFAPYHLLNAALNVQGSDYANRRGRNADFFIFSPLFVGSDATGYAATREFERATGNCDLATAMAISGAAASSNMGSSSIRPLRPTLALLNIRLGYWLRNPRYVGTNNSAGRLHRLRDWLKHRATLFLWSEISGRLYENSNDVYVTDGGHIENLGLYELLKRRCKLIIAVDAEADLSLHFPSFITLQRYARIDFGVRIDMPWGNIQSTTCAWMGMHAEGGKPPPPPTEGPHAAVGQIDYGDGGRGFILYVKASLTGDENDYVRDYSRRYQQFPHEMTGDQFFSEEQFEVYRALGFHIVHGVLSGRDKLQVCGANGDLTLRDVENEAVKAVHDILKEPAGR
jgi:Patatin-like phospholipase